MPDLSSVREAEALVVGDHGPESAQHQGWNVQSKLRDVALEERASEILSPGAEAHFYQEGDCRGRSKDTPQ